MTSVGDKVRAARDAKVPPWSVETLHRLSGVSAHAIRQWEQGRTQHPKPQDVQAVADALEIPIEWFYDGQPGEPPMRHVVNENRPSYRADLRTLSALIDALASPELTDEAIRAQLKDSLKRELGIPQEPGS